MKICRLLLVFLLLITLPMSVSAQAVEVDKKIQELQQKIIELKGAENTLSKQITILNSEIAVTTLKIAGTRAAIDKLTTEIDELAGEIDRLELMLTRRSELVLRRIPEAYKRRQVPQFGLVLLSRNFSDFLARVKYMTAVQEDDAQLLFQLKATQTSFSQRKDLREDKKIQQEALKKQLEVSSLELDRQKRAKQALLTQTQNDEAVYQKLLAQALAEKQALERALVEAVAIGPVKKGDPIALVGNSGYPGCSTGAHLHFEVHRGNTWVNAEEFVSGRDVKDQQNGGVRRIGNGSWDWPLEGDIIVTQRYGKTPYSWRYAYSGGIHTGIDMVSNSSIVIRAPKDGTLYSSSQACGNSSIIKIKYIDHGEGVNSFYLHVQ